MSLEPPPYLAQLQSNIRQRPIPWDGAARAGTITEDQLAKIRAVDKVRTEQRKQIVEGDLDGYRRLFVGEEGTPSVIETASKRSDVIKYVLVLLSDLLQVVPSLAGALFKNADPYKHFLPLLAHSDNSEDRIPLLTSSVLTLIMAQSKDQSKFTQDSFPLLISYLCKLVEESGDPSMQHIAVMEFSSMLHSKKMKQLFWKQRSETVTPLVDILRKAAGISSDSSASLWSGNASSRANEGISGGVGLQLLYHVLLIMWQLSFEAVDIGDEMDDEYDIILLYTQLLKVSPKMKTTRLILATFTNLLDAKPSTLLPTAMLARLPAVLQNVSGRNLGDDVDLQEDLEHVKETLEEYRKTKTTFDEYAAEVQSGHLRWSPPHKHQTFWTENARKILDHEHGQIPRKLAEIMKKPWDNDKAVLAIACNDIGCLVKEVPEKRGQLEKLGIKLRIMELMQDSDEAVRWESLRALGSWLKYSFEEQ